MRGGPSLAQTSALDRYVRFVNEADRLRRPADVGSPGDPIVTISRQAGCDAHALADAIVARLRPHARPDSSPWTVFDRDLVDRVLEEHGLPPRLAVYMPEDSVSKVADSVDEFLGIHPSTAVLVRRTAATIRGLAGVGNAVIIGRAANVVTADASHAFHVRLVGSFDRRVRRVEEREHLTRADATERVRRIDAGRRRYVKKYYRQDIDDPLLYDLVVNIDRTSCDEIAALVADAVLRRARVPTSARIAPVSS
ncbi:MAG: cytidylate kinase-like family protein [Actinomycetota bacterium]